MIGVAGENKGILLSAPIAPPSTLVLQATNGKGIKRFLAVSESSRPPDPDQHVQPKRRQTLKAAAKANGQQKLLFRQV